MGGLRTRGAALGLLAASVLFSLALGEGAVRLLRPQFVMGPDPIRNPFWRHDPWLGWAHRPSEEGTFAREEFSHPVRINSSGWRDRERSIDKPAGVLRIVALGDSFTWGHGVRDEEVFTRQMERLLDGVEVINLGLSATATDQQLLILRRHGLAYRPDLVLVMVTRNDFNGVMQNSEGAYPKPRFLLQDDGSLLLDNVPVPPVSSWARLRSWWLRRSALFNLVASAVASRSGPVAAGAAPADSYRLMRAILGTMKRESAAAGARFAIALAPSNAHTYFDEIPRLEARRFEVLRQAGEEGGFPVLDLVPAFRAAARAPDGRRIDLHYRKDLHWNAAGQELAARELARLLKERGLIYNTPR